MAVWAGGRRRGVETPYCAASRRGGKFAAPPDPSGVAQGQRRPRLPQIAAQLEARHGAGQRARLVVQQRGAAADCSTSAAFCCVA